MAMNLKTVLDGKAGQQELSRILKEARNDVYKDVARKRSKAKLNVLEGQLQRIFYPTGSTAISSDYYNRRMSQATEQQLVDIFNNFDFESNTKGHYEANTAMSPNTLKISMEGASNALEGALKRLENFQSLKNEKQIEEVTKRIRDLVARGNNILKEAENNYVLQFGQQRIVGDLFNESVKIVNQLRAFSKALSIPDMVSPQEAGILFEEALALTNFIDVSSNACITQGMRNYAIDKSQFGAEPVARNARGGIAVSYEVDASLFKDLEEAKKQGFKIKKGNATFNYSYDPTAAKQGKMDVQLHYNDGSREDYRISAKRWSGGAGDLGETSIDAGINRVGGLNVAEAYKFAVLTPRKDQINNEIPKYTALQNAHDFAILALKADIAMGISQGVTRSGAGYANVLVVDTGSSIKVRDLATIVLNQEEKLSKYSPKEIYNSAISSYNRIAKLQHGRTQSYLGLITSSLNKMKVTINMSFKGA